MALFITTFQYSEAGKKGLVSDPNDRGVAIASVLEKLGIKLINMYVKMDTQEAVLISQADNAAQMKAMALVAEASGSIGAITTSQAWTSADFVEICKSAGTASGAYSPPGA